MTNKIHIGDNLKGLIASRNVARTDLCEHIGLSESALSNYLNGRIPQSLEPIVALATYFDVSLDYLVTGQEHASGSAHRDIEYLLQHHAVEMEQRVEGQNDLFLRVVEALMKNTREIVNDAVKENESLNTSILDEDQVWTLEKCADRITVASPYMKNEVAYDHEKDQLNTGRYFNYIAKSIELNPDVRYHFIVNAEPLLPKNIELRFISLLHENGVRFKRDNIQITVSDNPIYSHLVIYHLIHGRVKAVSETLYQRIQPFADDNNEIGILLAPSDRVQLNVLMDKKNLLIAKQFLQSVGAKKKRKKKL